MTPYRIDVPTCTYEFLQLEQWVDCQLSICQNRIHLLWMSWISSPQASKSKIKSILHKLFGVWSLYFPSSVNTIEYCMIYQQLKIHFTHVAFVYPRSAQFHPRLHPVFTPFTPLTKKGKHCTRNNSTGFMKYSMQNTSYATKSYQVLFQF